MGRRGWNEVIFISRGWNEVMWVVEFGMKLCGQSRLE